MDLAIPGQHSLFNTAQHSGNTYSFLKVVCSRVFTCELRCMSYTCCSMGCYVAPESIYPGDPNHHFISHPRKEVSIFISQLCCALCLYLLTFKYTFKSWMNAPASPSEARELKRGTGKPPSLQYSNCREVEGTRGPEIRASKSKLETGIFLCPYLKTKEPKKS